MCSLFGEDVGKGFVTAGDTDDVVLVAVDVEADGEIAFVGREVECRGCEVDVFAVCFVGVVESEHAGDYAHSEVVVLPSGDGGDVVDIVVEMCGPVEVAGGDFVEVFMYEGDEDVGGGDVFF